MYPRIIVEEVDKIQFQKKVANCSTIQTYTQKEVKQKDAANCSKIWICSQEEVKKKDAANCSKIWSCSQEEIKKNEHCQFKKFLDDYESLQKQLLTIKQKEIEKKKKQQKKIEQREQQMRKQFESLVKVEKKKLQAEYKEEKKKIQEKIKYKQKTANQNSIRMKEQFRSKIKEQEKKISQLQESQKYLRSIVETQKSKIQQLEEKNQTANQQINVLSQKIKRIQEQLGQKMRQKQCLKPKIEGINFVSNHQQQNPAVFQYIKNQVQSFTSTHIKKTSLLYQSDANNQNIFNYLKKLQSSQPFVLLFYTKSNNIFGFFSQSITFSQQDNKNFKAFAFNASKQMTFFNPNDSNRPISPVSYADSCLVLGDRELVLKNNSLQIVKVFCGNIYGYEYFNIKRKQQLTGESNEEVALEKIELHKIVLH